MSVESTGGQVNYYLTLVPNPRRKEQAPYQAECEDIISSLKLTFDEATVFKSIWRTATGRLGTKKAGNSPLYNAEKILHYAQMIHRDAVFEQESKPPTPEMEVTLNLSFTPWHGGICPYVDSQLVEVILRGNSRGIETAGSLRWTHIDNEGDIVQYRLAE